MDNQRPIIIVKKKVAHAGHHGGAWKVAYADFVTAMMALFIVLWLLNTSKPVKEAIAGYFKDPSGTADKKGSSRTGTGDLAPVPKDDMPKLKAELENTILKMNDLGKLKDQIEITITPEGLRIELLESESGTFFDSGSRTPNAKAKELLVMLAQNLGKLPNKVSIEGHTDSKPYVETRDYGNWELSADRANSARRILQQSGLGPAQVNQVRGYADQKLRQPGNPLDPSNRRISVIVHHLIDNDVSPANASPGNQEPKTNSTPPSEPIKPLVKTP